MSNFLIKLLSYMKPLRYLIIFAIILQSFQLNAQYYSRGQDPSGINWKQIKTENFQIIFPSNYVEEAKYVADVFEYIYTIGAESLGHEPKKISVIIHNETIESNGFVAWAPKRVELFITPPQNNDTHTWMERLIVHEYRHVVQVDKLNQGITQILGWMFGEQAIGVVLGSFVPLWFLEGDAVVMETALTNSGRGRLPVFEQGLRAQILEKEIYSYNKAYFGSYKDYVPSYYELGYVLVAALRAEHGADVWDPVITNVARRPYTLLPFTFGMKKAAGVHISQHYFNTLTYLDSAWTKQREQTIITPIKHVPTANKLYSNYNNVHFINERSFIALKSGLKDIPKIVTIDHKGNEEVLFIPGRYMHNSLSYRAGKAVWSEMRRDPRWAHRSWSEIHLYDLKSGKHKKLSSGTKWFSPAISHNGQQIAVVESNELSENFLVIISAESGEEIRRFQLENNDFLMTPSWSSSGREIIFVALDHRGKRIDIINAETGNIETALPPTHVEISKPVFWGTHFFFNAAYSGINNIYYYDKRNKIINSIISTDFGVVNASLSPSGMQFACSDYTSEGYKIGIANIVDIDEIPVENIENNSVNFAETIAQQESGLVIPENIESKDHEVRNYSKIANLFRLHSWGPAVIDVSNTKIRPGISMLFQNSLSTSFLNTGYEHNINEGLGKLFVDYSYHGFYPVLSANYEIGRRKTFLFEKPFLYTEQSASGMASLPLSFNYRHLFYGFSPSVSISQFQFVPDVTDTIFSDDGRQYALFEEQSMNTLSYRAYAYIYRAAVQRDMNPRFGQVIDVFYSHNPLGGHSLGTLFGARSITYLPGILRHHSLKVTAGYQELLSGNSIFSYRGFLNYPRGIFHQRHRSLNTVFTDYAFPIIYPDMSLPGVVYIKRLSANMFFDYALAKPEDDPNNAEPLFNEEFMTCGIDLMADLHAFRFIAPFKLGPRIGYDLNSESFFFNFLFSVSF